MSAEQVVYQKKKLSALRENLLPRTSKEPSVTAGEILVLVSKERVGATIQIYGEIKEWRKIEASSFHQLVELSRSLHLRITEKGGE